MGKKCFISDILWNTRLVYEYFGESIYDCVDASNPSGYSKKKCFALAFIMFYETNQIICSLISGKNSSSL